MLHQSQGPRIPSRPERTAASLRTDGPVHASSGSSASPFGGLAIAVLDRQRAALVGHEAGVRRDDDPEELHAMRVAVRRLRAALSLFAGVLPDQARQLRQELGWLAGVLGAVRDLDVQQRQVEGWRQEAAPPDRDAYAEIMALLAERRSTARGVMVAALDSPRYYELLTAIVALVAQGPRSDVPAARRPVEAVAPALVRRRWRRVRAAGAGLTQSASAPELHRLRIRCKRLRDALEFLVDIYGRAARLLVRRLLALHDTLGCYQDAQVAAAHLRELRRTYQSALTPAAAALLEALAQRYLHQAERARRRALEVYPTLAGRPWRRLRRVLTAHRPRRGPTRSGQGAERPASGTHRPFPGRKQHVDLYLVRHASAAAPDPLLWPDDRERPLTPQGKKRFRSAARGLRRAAPRVGLVLSSPLTRAWQTARILEKAARWPAPLRCDAMAPEGTPEEVVRALVAYLGGEGVPQEPPTGEPAGEAPGAVDEGERGPDDESERQPALDIEDDRMPVPGPAAEAPQPPAQGLAIALVGHEPNLHELASYLLSGDATRVQLTFKKGGVACLSWSEDCQPGSAVLRWLLTPKSLRSLDT